jgi:Domain of unknown function (DUF4349)
MRKLTPYLALLIVTALLLSACLGRQSAPIPQAANKDIMATPMPARATEGEMARGGSDGGTYTTGEGGWDTTSALPDDAGLQQSRVVIYTGNMSLVVKDTEQAAAAISRLAIEQGGYVSGANLYVENKVTRGSITIRVPSEKYQDTLVRLRALAVRVERETISTDDVTQEYTDLEARKTNLKYTEQALQKLLDERQKVGKTQDILEVFRELSNVRGQIEQIEGRLRYLANQAALSTVSIELIPDVLYQPVTVAGWEPQGIAKSALQTLVAALQVMGTLVIWAGVFVIPLLIVILVPLALIVLVIRWLVRRRRTRKPA